MLNHSYHVPPQHYPPRLSIFNRRPASLIIVLVLFLSLLGTGIANVGPTRTTAAPIPCGDVAALRSAIAAANTTGGIVELASGCPYNLTDGPYDGPGPTGLPVITGNVRIWGNGGVIQRVGGPAFRIFAVAPGGSLGLVNLTVSGGHAQGGAGGNGNDSGGGGGGMGFAGGNGGSYYSGRGGGGGGGSASQGTTSASLAGGVGGTGIQAGGVAGGNSPSAPGGPGINGGGGGGSYNQTDGYWGGSGGAGGFGGGGGGGGYSGYNGNAGRGGAGGFGGGGGGAGGYGYPAYAGAPGFGGGLGGNSYVPWGYAGGGGGGAGLGGAVFVSAGGALNVAHTQLVNNRAQGGNGGNTITGSIGGGGGSGGSAFGGAIFTMGNLCNAAANYFGGNSVIPGAGGVGRSYGASGSAAGNDYYMYGGATMSCPPGFPGLTVTTASDATTAFSASPQPVTLSATVSAPYGVVDGGTVTFFVYQGGTLVGSPANVTVTNGNASVPYTLPAATPAGTYTIVASYGPIFPLQPSTDSSKVLTITPVATTTAAGNATTTYSTAEQLVTLNAMVSSSAGVIGAGSVTFTLKQGATVIGSPVTSATVSGGNASVDYTLPGGTLAGSYIIEAVYNAGGSFLSSSDLLKTLTIDAAATTTVVADSTATFSLADQSLTLNATVTSPAGLLNAGTVTLTLTQGGTVIGSPVTSGVLSSGNASAGFTLPGGTPVGSYVIEAVYMDPSGSLLSSSDTTGTLSVTGASTTTKAVDAAVTYSSTDQPVALSATVTSLVGAVNEGTVTFTITQASTPIGVPVTSGAVSGGAASATFTLPGGSAAGAYTIEATYTDPGGSFLTSTDSTRMLTVSAAATTTVALDAAATYSLADQPVALSANVTSPAGPVNEGTVTFIVSQGGTPVGTPVTSTVSGGSASAPFTLPGGTAAGSYAISAVYDSPGGSFLGSADTTRTLTVNAASTTTNASSAVATFGISDQSVTLSAAVSSPAGSVDVGTVTFTVKQVGTVVGVPVTSGTVSGGSASATFTLPGGTAAGSYAIEAVYSGAASLLSSSDVTQTLAVGQAVTTTTATSAAATFSQSDQSVTLSAAVISSAGTVNVGAVMFTVSQGGVVIGVPVTGSVSAGSASAAFTLPGNTPAGVYSIDVTYTDPGGSLQNSTGVQALTVSPAATTIAPVNAAAVYSLSDQSVALSATVTSPAGTVSAGVVTFTVRLGGTVIGVPVTGPVVGGAAGAAFTLPGGSPAGTYAIYAVYSGTASLLASSNATRVLSVGNAATSTTAASATATFSLSEQSVTLNATVASLSGPVNAGSVTFTVSQSGTVVGVPVTGPVSGGATSAVFTLPAGTPAGVYAIEAVYNASASLDGSSDTTQTLTVGNATTATIATDASATFSVGDQPLTLSATVTSPSGPVNTGSVTFTVSLGGTVVGAPVTSGTVSGGAASATYTLPGGTAVGSYAIQAVYNPDGSLDGSSDTTKSLTVIAPTVTVTPASLPGGTVGTAYDQTIGATGGVGPYTFALTTGALPPGLTFDTATGVLSGTPLAPGGTFDFTITATDTVSTGSESQAYSVVIGLPVLDLNPLVFPDGILTYSYAQSIAGSGGIGPYTFALSAGALPDGLILDGTGGSIAGRPEKLGTFTFALTVTDTVTTATASREYVIHVLEGPPPPPPTERCVDLNFDNESAVRASIPDEFAYALYCREMVKDGQFVTWLGNPIYHWGNVGNRPLVDMGILQAVDVFSPPDVRSFHDAVVCLRGTGRVFLLRDTFSTDHRTPEETTAWTTEAYPGFTCATLYSPATVVLVRAETESGAAR